MHFSLKRILTATAYVAVVAKTCALNSRNGVDALWLVTALAFTCAAILSNSAISKRLGVASDFVVLSVLYVAGLYVSPE
jgi:hypothetical protein